MATSCNYFKQPCDELNQIVFEDVDGRILQSIIDYCYTGQIEITVQNVEKMVRAALYMEVPKVVDKCENVWLENVSSENCWQIFKAAERYCFNELREKALTLLIASFEKIPISDMHACLDDGTLRMLLFHDDNIPKSEEIFFERLVKRMELDETLIEFKNMAPDLLKNVKLQHFSSKVS